jgi:transcription elongation GreA/GreB family factor
VSRAFVKETDETFDSLPDRPVSKHPNLVTSAGFEQIDATVARLHQERAAAQAANDRTALARIARDLRYWNSRKSTARVMHAPTDSGVVHFGCTVVIAREDGSQQSYRIVGEDEADPSRGTISYTSPLAQALIGKQIGDAARVGRYETEIVEIRPFEDLPHSGPSPSSHR